MITVERRIQWAEQRLNELWEAIDTYLDREPVDVQVEDAEPGSYVFRGYVRKQAPDELILLTGDFIHNLPASLDNLIWELAGATAGRPNSLSFVIRKTPEAFDNARSAVVAGVHPAIVIRTCQPFVLPHQGGLDGGDRLGLLDDFWNDDKHRGPAVIPGLYYTRSATVWTSDEPPPAIQSVTELPFSDGAVIARLDGWLGPRPYVERASLTYEPRFLTLRAPDHAVMRYAFRYMVAMVREILPRFAAFR